MIKERIWESWRRLPHPIRWVTVACVGGTLVIAGVVFMVLPGPGIPLIIIGLAILATEFAWAERTLSQVKVRSSAMATKAKGKLGRKKTAPPTQPD